MARTYRRDSNGRFKGGGGGHSGGGGVVAMGGGKFSVTKGAKPVAPARTNQRASLREGKNYNSIAAKSSRAAGKDPAFAKASIRRVKSTGGGSGAFDKPHSSYGSHVSGNHNPANDVKHVGERVTIKRRASDKEMAKLQTANDRARATLRSASNANRAGLTRSKAENVAGGKADKAFGALTKAQSRRSKSERINAKAGTTKRNAAGKTILEQQSASTHASTRIANAATMHGTGSKQHEQAKVKFATPKTAPAASQHSSHLDGLHAAAQKAKAEFGPKSSEYKRAYGAHFRAKRAGK